MSALYLVRLILDRRAVLRVGAQHRLGQSVDEGALLHAGLSQLFAVSNDHARVPLRSFAVDDFHAAAIRQPDVLPLLAYSEIDARGLAAMMGPTRSELVRLCDAREMPRFEAGQRLTFRTRVCPVARTRKPGDRPLGSNRQGRTRHREMDVFVHATLDAEPQSVNREALYTRWLEGQIARDNAGVLERAHLAEFRRESMRRGRGPRLERPNAVMEGTLAVQDPGTFRILLARGLGRHRAFGFGMLLLRAP